MFERLVNGPNSSFISKVNYTAFATCLAMCIATTALLAQDAKKVDPTDPTNIQLQVIPSYEFTKLTDGNGDTHTFAVDTWIPLTKKDLLTVELRGVHSNFPGLPSETGFGDIRMRYFHLIATPGRGALRAFVPSFDLIIPTGQALKGTGGGSWMLMPNFVLALDIAPGVSAYPFFRYVHSISKTSGFEGTLTSLLPGLGIPIDDPSLDGLLGLKSDKVRGFNMEVPITFALSDQLFFTATPNFFHNFAGGGATTFSSKFSLTYAPSPRIALGIETNIPFSGNNGIDYAVKPSATIYF